MGISLYNTAPLLYQQILSNRWLLLQLGTPILVNCIMGDSESKPAPVPEKEYISCSMRNSKALCENPSKKPKDCYWSNGCYTKGGVGQLSVPNGRADTLDEGLLETILNKWDQDE